MRTVMVTSVSRKMSNVCFKAHTRFLFQGEISKQHLQKKLNLDLLVSKDMIWIYIYIYIWIIWHQPKKHTQFSFKMTIHLLLVGVPPPYQMRGFSISWFPDVVFLVVSPWFFQDTSWEWNLRASTSWQGNMWVPPREDVSKNCPLWKKVQSIWKQQNIWIRNMLKQNRTNWYPDNSRPGSEHGIRLG